MRLPKSSCMRMSVTLIVLRNQHRKYRGQQHKHDRLHNSDKQFHKIKWNWQQPREPLVHRRHRFENAFARVNVSEQSKTERDRAEQNRNNFQPTDHEENNRHQNPNDAGGFAFWSKQVLQKTADTLSLECPDQTEHEKDRGHGSSHV